MEAILALEDGTVYRGEAFGADGERTGEIVFNTSMTGYQEILTDPSYAGQIVVMTYPHIGNYGINSADIESRRPFVEGFVVREYSRAFSNWRAEASLDDYMKHYGIVGIAEIDTRALVRHIRGRGAMRACLSTQTLDAEEAVRRARAAPSMLGLDLASRVTCEHPYVWNEWAARLDPANDSRGAQPMRFHVVAYDFGVKFNILRQLAARGCWVTVVPAHTSADDVLALKPDGVFLSNGPGDPEPLTGIVANIRRLIGRVPIFGICLGHQLLGLAFGGRTYKLKFGHRGGNQPVKNLRTGRVEITAHNHGFAVAAETLPPEIEPTHINLNDGTLEGMRHRTYPIFSVQYHPEASPGPHDALYLFDDFIRLMELHRRLRLTRLEATGQEKTIAILGPDALFGELPEGPREFVLEALDDLTVKTVERQALDEHAASIMRMAVPSEGGEIAFALPPARLLYTAPRPRLARVLLQLAEEYGVPPLDKQLVVPVKLTARALMHLTCLPEEAVREALEMLLAERLIAFEGRRLFIRHRAELERVAESNV